MGGLLYKDFVAVNRIGKIKATWMCVTITLAFIVLRIAFPGTAQIDEFMEKTESGEVINMLDAIFLTVYALWIFASVSLINVSKIMENDEKNKVKDFLNVMPLKNDAYVASKYIFMGIAAYVFMSIDYIWGITCAAFCKEGRVLDLVSFLNSFVIPIICIILLLASIELPLYIGLGKEKAKRAMIVFWTVIALVVIGFLMFGDLSITKNWDAMALMNYVKKHETAFAIFQSMEPVIILIIYYLSYRISRHLYNLGDRNNRNKKEGEM